MPTFIAVNAALLPFIVLWVLLGTAGAGWAVGAALAVSLAGVAWRAARREVLPLEAAGGGFLLLLGAGELVAPAWTAANALWLSFAALGVVSLASVALRRPWTADFSRLAYPEQADTPQFFAINAAITGVWGVLFLAYGACTRFGAPLWASAGITVVGVAVSIFGPRLGIRLALHRLRAAQETFHWRPPAFAGGAPRDCDVAVIGAGIGGLSAAALLADAGLKVAVFDHHVVAGGFCHSYLRKAHDDNRPVIYRFDAGPHDFSGVWPGGPISGLLDRLGLADRLRWERVDHSYRIDGERIDVPRDWRDYVRLLGERFPGSAAGIAALFGDIHAIFEGMYSTGRGRGDIPGTPATDAAMLAFPRAHPLATQWMHRPFDELVGTHLRDARVIGLINALAGYLGDGSERLTCARMAPIFGYYFKGGYYPIGGSSRLPDLLVEAIRQRGGEVHLKTPVRRILVEHGRAAGVALDDGRIVRAAAVVSNADIKSTFLDLLERAHVPAAFRQRLAEAAPATSAFSVHLGINYVPDLRPSTHLTTPMPLGIAMLSGLDPSAAPAGHATLMLITLVPFAEAERWFPEGGGDDWKEWRRSDEYESRKTELGDRMIAAAETVIPGLPRHIVYRADASPVTYARYDWASAGAIYGISGEGRLRGAKSPVPGLVIAGGGNAGAGVEAVVISGAEAAEALLPGVLAGTARVSRP